MDTELLRRMRRLVQRGEYVLTLHVLRKLRREERTVFDLESVVLRGTLVERQRDREWPGWKYVVEGATRTGSAGAVVVRFTAGGKLVFITFYPL
jgi:hypothetical protein